MAKTEVKTKTTKPGNIEPELGMITKPDTMAKEESLPTQYISPEGKNCKVPPIKHVFNGILVSAHTVNAGKIISPDAALSTDQVVVAKGPHVTCVELGDWVRINVDMFKHQSVPGKHDTGNKIIVHAPLEDIRGTKYLNITDRHIKFVIIKT